ncbi:hypothetical protein pb186bvf_018061 [Paramecium bursaria]
MVSNNSASNPMIFLNLDYFKQILILFILKSLLIQIISVQEVFLQI